MPNATQDSFIVIVVNATTGQVVSTTTVSSPPAANAFTLPPAPADMADRGPLADLVGFPLRMQARPRLTTPWPYIGTREFDPRPTPIFSTPEWRAAWKPGQLRQVYVGQCTALGELARKIQIPLSKASTTGPGNIWNRTSQLNTDGYGATILRNGEYTTEARWDDWNPALIGPHNLLPSPGSPVRPTPRGLIVTLPNSMPPRAFDTAFDAQIAHGSIGKWAGTASGRAHLAALGVPAEIVQRLTAYPGGLEPEIRPAREIVCFSIKSHTDRLIAIIETVILRHLKFIA